MSVTVGANGNRYQIFPVPKYGEERGATCGRDVSEPLEHDPLECGERETPIADNISAPVRRQLGLLLAFVVHRTACGSLPHTRV